MRPLRDRRTYFIEKRNVFLPRGHFRNPRLLCVSPPICQALAGDALERDCSTLFIRHTELGAIVVSEVELGDIALKMLLANMVIRSDQAALEDVEEALGGIDMSGSASVFALSMGDGGMFAKLRANGDISAR